MGCTQINEIPDVCFEGFQVDIWKGGTLPGFSKIGEDRQWRSGKYGVTRLFFTSTGVCIYHCVFCLYSNEKQEYTKDYFYRDITNFTTASQSVDAYDGSRVSTVDMQRFSIIVPGDQYNFETQMDIEQSVRAMKYKLREKKDE